MSSRTFRPELGTERPLVPVKRKRRLGFVAVKVDWKYWSAMVKESEGGRGREEGVVFAL